MSVRRGSVRDSKQRLDGPLAPLQPRDRSTVKSQRTGGFRVNLVNTKNLGPLVGKLPVGFQHTFGRVSPGHQRDGNRSPTVSAALLLQKASAQLVEPLAVQKRARQHKRLKINDFAMVSILSTTDNDPTRLAPLG